jgi:hypothetical protein
MATVPSGSPASDLIPDSTILFDEDEQTIEHVLSKVLRMNALTYAQRRSSRKSEIKILFYMLRPFN